MIEKIQSFLRKWFPKREPIEISYTKVSAYRFCPWKYKLLFVDGYRVGPTPQIALGLSVHKTLEAYHRNGKKDLDSLLDAYNEFWVNEGFVNPQQTMQYYEKGEKMVRDYFEWNQGREGEVVEVEKEFRIPYGSWVLRGTIDRIDRLPDGSYEVIDYKTHAEMWTEERVAGDLQLTLYAIGCKAVTGQEPARLSYLFLAHRRCVTTARTRSEKEEALKVVESAARRIESRDFKPDVSRCPKCDFRRTCVHSTAKQSNGEKHG